MRQLIEYAFLAIAVGLVIWLVVVIIKDIKKR